MVKVCITGCHLDVAVASEFLYYFETFACLHKLKQKLWRLSCQRYFRTLASSRTDAHHFFGSANAKQQSSGDKLGCDSERAFLEIESVFRTRKAVTTSGSIGMYLSVPFFDSAT